VLSLMLFRLKNLFPVSLLALALAAGCTFSQKEDSPGTPFESALERPALPAGSKKAPVSATTATAAEGPFDPAGISRRYMGRQIARVMGHESTTWLDRPTREREERPDVLLKELRLKPTDVVADIGAGSGYLTFRIAPLVPQGKVYAVEIQPTQMLALSRQVVDKKISNVKPIRGTNQNPNLAPNSVDLVLLNNAYHQFAFPKEMLAEIKRALKPKGRIALVEYRAEDPSIPVKPIHKMTLTQCRTELTEAGFAYRDARQTLPRQHLVFFEKLPE
jgi:SAM-dependent methyltransferase